MQALTHYGARLMAATIKALPAQNRSAKEFLDDGTPLSVRVSKRGDRLHIHYHSPPQHPGNLNATPAIVQSVTLYVLRLLLQQSLPMNEGLLANIKLIISPGLLAPDFRNARHWPAVVGGNTEVSQRLTDTLIKAFGLAACSQGTMNNVIFGNDHFGYYETICGGVGAGRGFQGASAVHQHMTNTRITDPELLELRYPVRLLSFAIRKNSGGHGQWRGGDGVMRAIEFREPVQMNLFSQHRIEKPYGLKGGQPGKVGRQYVLQPSGSRRQLRGIDHYAAAPGDILIIETPGGGGFGRIRRK
jgi:5-oxoprolinase (ATP-hydrolysing)